jgi:hypothetical protein
MWTDTPVPTPLVDSVLVVDDFYVDPVAVRDIALRLEYRDFGAAANFPGQESVQAWHTPRHAERFADIVGTPITYDPRRWVFGKFRVAGRADHGHTHVHVDNVDWTAVVYLSRPQDTTGGLGIYRYLPLRLDRVPDHERLTALGYADRAEFDQRCVLANSTRADRWELLYEVPIRFNRCVVFRGARLFHGITATFGSGVADSRLTQNFFFHQSEVSR